MIFSSTKDTLKRSRGDTYDVVGKDSKFLPGRLVGKLLSQVQSRKCICIGN
jgi:hypothetical protein